MARVVAVVPDLLFGSKVQGMLAAAGHEVELVGSAEEARSRAADVVIVDLTAGEPDVTGIVGRVPTLAFYSHVDADVRARAEEAGYDLVVPRSRMAREGPDLVGRLVS
ncbi:MAG: hypothetical protein ACJ76K_03435 [Solirubrobacteraceae bacterium]